MLEQLNYPRRFISWIMRCVTTMRYSVLVNGFVMKALSGDKGLGKGEPFSPYLFAFDMVYFTMTLDHLKNEGLFSFILDA